LFKHQIGARQGKVGKSLVRSLIPNFKTEGIEIEAFCDRKVRTQQFWNNFVHVQIFPFATPNVKMTGPPT
jgi:hypothetical protein